MNNDNVFNKIIIEKMSMRIKKEWVTLFAIFSGVFSSIIIHIANDGYSSYFGFDSVFLQIGVFNFWLLLVSVIILVLATGIIQLLFPIDKVIQNTMREIFLRGSIFLFDIFLVISSLAILILTFFPSWYVEVVMIIASVLTIGVFLVTRVIYELFISKLYNKIPDNIKNVVPVSIMYYFIISLIFSLLLFCLLPYEIVTTHIVVKLIIIVVFVFVTIVAVKTKPGDSKIYNNQETTNSSRSDVKKSNTVKIYYVYLFAGLSVIIILLAFFYSIYIISSNYASNAQVYQILEKNNDENIQYVLLETTHGKTIIMSLTNVKKGEYELSNPGTYNYYDASSGDNITEVKCFISKNTNK